jgi:hypothetical protein
METARTIRTSKAENGTRRSSYLELNNEVASGLRELMPKRIERATKAIRLLISFVVREQMPKCRGMDQDIALTEHSKGTSETHNEPYKFLGNL